MSDRLSFMLCDVVTSDLYIHECVLVFEYFSLIVVGVEIVLVVGVEIVLVVGVEMVMMMKMIVEFLILLHVHVVVVVMVMMMVMMMVMVLLHTDQKELIQLCLI